jgi:hypothetical protein
MPARQNRLTRSRHVQTGSGADALAAAFQGRHTRTAGLGEGMQFTRGEEHFHGLGQTQMDTDQHGLEPLLIIGR